MFYVQPYLPEEMIQFDLCIFFQMGWFNHQLDRHYITPFTTGDRGAHLVKTNHSRLLEKYPNWGFVAQASHLKVEVARVEDGEDGDTPSSWPIWGGRCAPFMMLLNIVCVYLDEKMIM